MRVGDFRPFTLGQRLRMAGHHYIMNGRPKVAQLKPEVLEVARIEEGGIVCDYMQPRGDGTWRNCGHRFLYKWDEQWDMIERL